MQQVTYDNIFHSDSREKNRFMCWHYDEKIIKKKNIIIDIKNNWDWEGENPEYISENGFSKIEIFLYCLKAISDTVGGEDMSIIGFEYKDNIVYPIAEH